jgi:radical SAM/Cys-rich protein
VSLAGANHPLASAAAQLRVLQGPERSHAPFDAALARAGLFPLTATGISVLQVNVGKFCNQTCRHCHVDAGPDRLEIMTRETAAQCIEALRRSDIPTLDITGGAPELNSNFRWLVEQGRSLGRTVMDRCNLTVLGLPSQSDLAAFLANHQVAVVASLPYFLREQTDAQRGAGVFEKSIAAIRRLNELGYGQPETGLTLDLVYNPVGAFLPPPQHAIEADFRRELQRRHGVVFNSLFTITNMPISRFLDFLLRSGNYDRYMEKLVNAFNPSAARGVMCREMISVGWDGKLYDCDFNQMLDIGLEGAEAAHISSFHPERLGRRRIVTGQHCYGCTAGSGSSCGGATT